MPTDPNKPARGQGPSDAGGDTSEKPVKKTSGAAPTGDAAAKTTYKKGDTAALPAQPASGAKPAPQKPQAAAKTTAAKQAAPKAAAKKVAAKPTAKKPSPKKPPRKKASRDNSLVERAARRAGSTSVGHAIGQYFYLLGFYAECKLIQVWRVLRSAGLLVAQLSVWLFGGMFRGIGRYFKNLFREITEPFRRFNSGMRNIRRVMADEKKQGGSAGKKALGYFGSGVKNYVYLVLNLLKMLLPIAAAAVFFFVAYTVLNYDYNLAVVVNGEVVGHITDEVTFEDARVMLRERIVAAEGKGGESWQIVPAYHISTSNEITTKQQLVNNILLSYDTDEDDALVEAVGLYIEGTLYAVTTEGEELQSYLQSMLDEYYDPNKPEVTVDFVKTVEYELDSDDLFYASSVMPIEELKSRLSGIEYEEETYTTLEGDTLMDIAHAHDLQLSILLAYNPDYTDSITTYNRDGEEEEIEGDFEPEPGTVLVVQPRQRFLQVGSSRVEYVETEIPYEVIEEETTSITRGVRRITQAGENGLYEIPYIFRMVDGIETVLPAEGYETRVLLEPVPEVVSVGTFVAPATGTVGGYGAYLWPVPQYTGVSRGVGGSHRGLDITAPAWTPIYSSNAGTVTTAGWHYSYGNYVIIDHGDGIQTLYAHCIELAVSAGDVVGSNALVGYVGSTGTSTGNHLHIEFHVNGSWVDPYGYIARP